MGSLNTDPYLGTCIEEGLGALAGGQVWLPGGQDRCLGISFLPEQAGGQKSHFPCVH